MYKLIKFIRIYQGLLNGLENQKHYTYFVDEHRRVLMDNLTPENPRSN